MKGKIGIGLLILFASCLGEEPVSELAQLNKDIKIIDDYLEANPPDPSDIIVMDATGIRLVISEVGVGPLPPNQGNNLKVNYTGRLLSTGAEFDEGTLFTKLSDPIIDGWKIGLALLPKGSVAKLYVPSGYAYGTSGQGAIPGNANLVFDIHLESVESTVEQIQRLQDDVEAIDAHIANEEITGVTEHESGIRYKITELGTGASPFLYSTVKLNYKGMLMSDGSVFTDQVAEPGANFSSRVVNYPHGVLLGLQLIPEGSKATFYVPSVLAFGANSYTGVPANSIIIFEIDLLEIIE